MPDVSSIVFDIIRFLAPGLLFMQVLYLMGFARKGSDSQWVIQGIVLSLPIRWVGTQLVTRLGLETNPLTFEIFLLAVALVGSLLLSVAKGLLSFGDEAED
jgi:fucose 4-O-acetylase-like acetyltransferase